MQDPALQSIDETAVPAANLYPAVLLKVAFL